MCERIVGDSALADDLVQETYLQVLRNIDRLEVRDGLMPWLVTVAKRRSLNELRRHRYSTPVDAVPERTSSPETDPCEVAALSDEVARVKDALSGLTPRERDLLLRQVYRGMSLAELADEDASTAASVRSVLNRARSKIRNAVTEGGALVLAPLTAGASWARRRLDAVTTRSQELTPAAVRLGEIVAAGVMTATLTTGGAATTPAVGALAGPSGIDLSDAALATPASTATTAPVPVTTVEASAEAPPTTATTTPPAPTPTDALPIDPTDPLPRADEPEDAHYSEIAASRDGRHFFALGEANGKCHVDCTTLFRSTDGGATWERLAARGLMANSLLLAPDYPADPRIFAMGPSGLQVSDDGGQSFSSVLGIPSGPATVVPDFGADGPRILVGSTPAWQYDPASDTRQPLSGTPASTSSTPFAAHPDSDTDNPTGGSAGHPSGQVYAGAFTFTGDRTQAAVYSCRPMLDHLRCFRNVALDGLRAAPSLAALSGDRVVFAWGPGAFFRSGNSGATFQEITLPFANATAVTEDREGRVFVSGFTTDEAGTRGGVARSTDGGETWTLLGEGTPLAGGTSTVRASGHRIIAGPLESAGGGLLCSVDGGATWNQRCA